MHRLKMSVGSSLAGNSGQKVEMTGQKRGQLYIVFQRDCEPSTNEIQIGTVSLGHSASAGGINDVQALRTIIDVLESFGTKDINDHGRTSSAASFLKSVEKQGKWSRPIEAGGMYIHFGHVSALRHSFICIEEISASSASSWERWVEQFLAFDGFVQAWLSDAEHDYWQNAKDTLQYLSMGLSYSSLPMKSNGLQPPLEKMEIDTTSNPGRRLLRSGYVEAIGASMWLGAPFWEIVGVWRKDALFSLDWLKVQTLDRGVIYLVADERNFCDESTGDIQNQLRAALYGSGRGGSVPD